MTVALADKKWAKILKWLKKCDGCYVGNEEACRHFVEGVLWIMRSGAAWRLLPAAYGKWNSVYKRYARWCTKHVWRQLHHLLHGQADLEYLVADSCIIQAHICACGAPKQHRGQAGQALGRSRGGLSSKIHLLVDSHGNPLDILLSGGESPDLSQAHGLLIDWQGTFVIADKGYDADSLVEWIEERGAIAVIPPRSNRTAPRFYDAHLYQERHLVECCFNKLQRFRRIATHYDKLAARWLGFIRFAAVLLWLR